MNGILTAFWSIIIFSMVIFIHELGHFLAAKRFGVKVHEFAIGMGPALFKKQKGETLYSIRAIPMGGYCKMEGEDEASEEDGSFSRKKPYQRFIILFAGAFMNMALGFLIVVLSTSIYQTTIATRYVDSLVPGLGAEQVGVLSGDKILKIDDVSVYTPLDFDMEINKKQNVELTVSRSGERLTLTVPIMEHEGRRLIGFSRKTETKNIFNVIKYSYFESFSIVKMTYKGLFGLFNGETSIDDMSGPLAIMGTIGEAAKKGLYYVLFIAMLLSLNLGVMNLLPFPALDGGRIMFVLFEMITKKKPKPEIEGYIHLCGFVILIGLMLYVTKNDIMRSEFMRSIINYFSN